jgi:hypothetical protein
MELATAMLADAAHNVAGKLYVLGGQWDRLMAPALPVQHPTMTVVLVVRLEYNEAPKTYDLGVELTLDGQPQGIKAVGQFAVGHGAGQVHGAPQFVPLAIPFNNLTFKTEGRYEWVITVSGTELGRIPLEVTHGILPRMPPPSAGQQTSPPKADDA